MKIGSNQRQELDFLRETLDSLGTIVDRKMCEDFSHLRQRLEDWATKVAIVGQVKAGKSSFLNAILGQPDLLPTDINPWTSVVTNIRINLANDPVSGARFDFFSETEWDEIVAGGTQIRKLTEQLLPGFDTETLRRQSNEMRGRAQKSLGQHYYALLGNHHDYDVVTPDLMKRYVCAGPSIEDGPDQQALCRYAALTKLANIYMRLPDFQVPTIISDTPGVNDPFLLRDEFTCRSLDHSDHFIMVLSAHQPLTEVDIALIRILAKQEAKDVMIFVNRIDELDDYSREVPRVMEDVTRRLRKAIPGIEFQIMAGSAHLAELALRSDPEAERARAAVDTEELAAYVQAKHGFVPAERANRLLLASGIDNVKMILSDLIDGGHGNHPLKQLSSDLRAALNGTQFATRRERESLQLQAESVRPEVAEFVITELETELRSLRDVRNRLESHAAAAESQIEKIISKSWSSLEGKLLNCIDLFIDDQRIVFEERIRQALQSGSSPKELDIDLAPLQRQLEDCVVQAFQRSRAGIDVSLNTCMHASLQTVKEKFANPTETITLADLPCQDFTSSLILARRKLRIGLVGDRSWAFWREQTTSIEKSIAALRSIAAEELRPSVEKILTAFDEAQTERAGAGSGRIRKMLRMFDLILCEQVERLRSDKAEMEAIARNPEIRTSMVRRIQTKMEVLERRLLKLSAIDTALSRSGFNLAA